MASRGAVRAQDLKALRTGVIATAVVLPAAALVAGLVVGPTAAGAAACGVCLAAAFFAASMLAVDRVARVSPQLMMPTALATYLVKMVALLGLVAVLRRVDWWPSAVFGFSVLGAAVVWIVAEVKLVLSSRVLYVSPEEG